MNKPDFLGLGITDASLRNSRPFIGSLKDLLHSLSGTPKLLILTASIMYFRAVCALSRSPVPFIWHDMMK